MKIGAIKDTTTCWYAKEYIVINWFSRKLVNQTTRYHAYGFFSNGSKSRYMIIRVFFNDCVSFEPSYIFIATLLFHSSVESENQCCIHKDGSSPLGRASATILRMMYKFHACNVNQRIENDSILLI